MPQSGAALNRTRLLILLTGFVDSGFCVFGMEINRAVGDEHIGVRILLWWHAVAAGPSLVFAVIASMLAVRARFAAHPGYRMEAIIWTLCLAMVSCTLVAAATYAIYDFEHPRKLSGAGLQK